MNIAIITRPGVTQLYKEDANFIQSESHPDLSNSSEPCKASRALSRKSSSEGNASGKGKSSVTNYR